MNFTLYEISNEYQKILDELETAETEEEKHKCLELMESISDGINDKVINVTKTIKSIESFAVSIEESVKSMEQRAKSLRKKSKWLRNYLITHMKDCEINKVETPELCVTLRKNAPSVIIEDESKVPLFLKKIKKVQQVDKKAVKEFLNSGEKIEGVKLESSFTILVK